MAHPREAPVDIAGMAFAIALFALFLVTPDGSADAAPATPTIDFMMATRSTVFTDESTEVFCIAHHADDRPLIYTWFASEGILVPSNDSALWFAPAEPGTYTVSVEVRDDAGSIAYDSVTIAAVPNEPPVVASLTAVPSQLLPGESATLTCDAYDPEGQAIEYEWLGPSGYIEGTGPVVTWTAPARPGPHNVVVKVTDEMGASHTRNVRITVVCPTPPQIEELLVWPMLPDYTTEDVRGGYRLLRGSYTECELECIAVAPYGDLTYQWSATDGSISGTGPIVLFTPPHDTAEVYVTVVVRDVCGQSAEAEMLFRVFLREEYSTVVDYQPGCLRCLYGY